MKYFYTFVSPCSLDTMLNSDLILVLLVLLFILISLYRNLFGISFTLLIGIIALGIFGVLTPSEILAGFANEQVAVVILMLLYSDIIRKTDIIEFIFDRLFRKVRTYRGFVGRMMFTVSSLSMFLNNVPLVAVMMPYINSWARCNDFPPSKFLIPLSYAAILGGSATLIGTSTNLIINSMVVGQKILPEMEKLKLFDFIWVGIPMMILGSLYLVLYGNRLLPSRIGAYEDFATSSRAYLIESRVRSRSHLIGKSLGDSGLLDIKGLSLIAILRKSIRITDVPKDVVLDGGDILVFSSETSNIASLINEKSGLILPEVGMLTRVRHANVVEVVISQNSSLHNKTVRESHFRGRFDAAIISVHRNGEKIEGKVGNIFLRTGDVLLLFAGENFISRSSDTSDFYFISKVSEFLNLPMYKSIILIGGLFLFVLLSALNVLSLFVGLTIMIMTAILLKVSHPREIPHSIDYNLALVIVLSLAFGTAMMKSGAADLLAQGVISAFFPLGKVAVLTGIYLITAFLSAYFTTKASVAIIFPVALSVAQQLGISGTPFVLAVAYAAACTFITPHGYVTNLMVNGPGGYTAGDFMKAGLPLTFMYMLTAIAILSIIYF
jgi:di/tricarboxylate transporter